MQISFRSMPLTELRTMRVGYIYAFIESDFSFNISLDSSYRFPVIRLRSKKFFCVVLKCAKTHGN